MAQLDKTFPTNDCSACILAPKVTDTYSHPLINTMTLSEVVKIKGEAPNFKVVIRRKARYIKPEKCKGCSDCVPVCPISVKSEFDMEVGNRKAIYKPFAQAVPNIVSITKKGTSPCKFRCPAHMDAHGYIALAGQGRWEEALEVVRRTTPFAGVLGRICFHPCEENCSRRLVDDPLNIPVSSACSRLRRSKQHRPAVEIEERPRHQVAVMEPVRRRKLRIFTRKTGI